MNPAAQEVRIDTDAPAGARSGQTDVALGEESPTLPRRPARADVVVSTRGRGSLIDGTLVSIRASTETDFELWIIDQSDDDRTKETVLRHAVEDPRVHYVPTSLRGSDFGRNTGAAAGGARCILYTDDDCRPEPSWLGAMAVELEDPDTWAVFGRVVPDPETLALSRPGSLPVHPAISLALKNVPARRVYQRNRFDLGFGHGASMGCRRDRFEQVGGFDVCLGAGSRFPSWPERDLGYRILRMGGRIVYTPEAVVYHRHWRDWPEVRRTYRNYGLGAGAAVAKYVRCGDRAAVYLLVEWMLDQGVRQALSGLLKWRCRQKVEIGLIQLSSPWVGLARSWRHPVDRKKVLYTDSG